MRALDAAIESAAMPRLYVIGALVYDLVFEVPDWIEADRAVHASRLTLSPGGKALSQAAAASLLGADAALIGCVGDDLFGDEMLKALRDVGVDISHIRVHASARTSLASIIVKDGSPAFIGAPDASRKVSGEQIADALRTLRSDDMLLVDFEIPQDLVAFALRMGRDAGATTVLNPAPFFTRDAFVFDYLPLVDIIIPNKLEAGLIVGGDSRDIDGMARSLLSAGVGQVVMTLGQDGCVCCEAGQVLRQAAFAVDVVDATGASDAFVGAYCRALLDARDLRDALRFATAAAALACARHGTMTALPNLDEVYSLLG